MIRAIMKLVLFVLEFALISKSLVKGEGFKIRVQSKDIEGSMNIKSADMAESRSA